MNDADGTLLDSNQMMVLRTALHEGSTHASAALADWLGKPSVIEIDSLTQLPIEEATTVLSAGEEPICFCSMEINGLIAGEVILAFDNSSGLALADMLLNQPQGTTTDWTEIAISAALETTNILCCAYLNSLSQLLSNSQGSVDLVPAPPTFKREFAESLMEFALMGQAVQFDQVIVAQTRFEIDTKQLNWTLLFLPDAESMSRLPGLLADSGVGQ